MAIFETGFRRRVVLWLGTTRRHNQEDLDFKCFLSLLKLRILKNFN